MELILLIAVFLLLVVNVALFVTMRQKPKAAPTDAALSLLQNQINELSRTLDTKMTESTRSVSESMKLQLSESQKLVRDITREITEVKETNKQVFSITESLRNLEKVLKNQKQRGALGEAGLELILSNVLPPDAFTLQHQFKNGDTVDAVIHTKEGVICIDAKFSLDNYNRIIEEEDDARREELEKEFKNDLKKRIDETAKYVRPKEGTLPFALMYIPAEGIYYDLLINRVGTLKTHTRNLIEYAYRDKGVIIVSPTTFVAYLQTILQGFRAFKIEESAREIEKRVDDLRRHLLAYGEHHTRLGNSLGTVVNHYNQSDKSLKMIDKDILRISGEGLDRELLDVPRPREDE
jgi:DNA recombination protein RmuC